MTNKCNLDIIFKELEKDPKFHDVRNWLKGIEDDAMLSTVDPVVQANVPGFVSTEAVGKLGVGSKLPEFVSPESMGNLRAGTRLPGFVRPESMENVGAVASYLNLFLLKLWDVLERVPSYLDLVPHSD